MSVLNVAEKNDAAKGIAQFLSRGNTQRKEGRSKFNKIYEFEYNLNGNNCNMMMTSVSGHLLNLAFPSSVKNWNSVDPLTLFNTSVHKTCTDNSLNIRKTLEELVRRCKMLIIWTDCDREGENIGMEIVEVCQQIKPNILVKRAKFSEITFQSVTRAANNLVDVDLKQSSAVDVRQELDLKTGAAFTRLQTLRLRRSFPSTLDSQMISYGSCQFPTLGFVVERYRNVENFQPEPYWKIALSYKTRNNEPMVSFIWDRNRLFDQNVVQTLFENINENRASLACVVDVVSKPKSKWRPVALDTVELEKLASRKLKISAKDTMTIAEKLYSKGFISYPRTETNIFPKEMNLTDLVEKQTSDQRWADFSRRIISDYGGPNPHNGKKTDKAHPPIHPLKAGGELSGNEARLFELVTRHFLACLSRNAEGHETKISVECLSEQKARDLWVVTDNPDVNSTSLMRANNTHVTDEGELFFVTGLVVLQKNYLDVYVYDKWTDKELPNLTVGQVFKPTSLEVQSGATTPPTLLTEADLITLMDKHGIGTDATHAEHIEKIKLRLYIGNTGPSDKYLVPSRLGMGLVEAYDSMGFYLAQPNLRADFEKDLQQICDGNKNPNEVLSFYINSYRQIFENVQQQQAKLDEGVGKFLEESPQSMPDNLNLTSDQQSFPGHIEDVRNCPSCQQGRVVAKKTRTNNKWMLGCDQFPACKYSVWFDPVVANVRVARDSNNSNNVIICQNNNLHANCPAGENVNKIAVKLNRPEYNVLGTSVRNEEGEFVVCLYCDSEVLQEITSVGKPSTTRTATSSNLNSTTPNINTTRRNYSTTQITPNSNISNNEHHRPILLSPFSVSSSSTNVRTPVSSVTNNSAYNVQPPNTTSANWLNTSTVSTNLGRSDQNSTNDIMCLCGVPAVKKKVMKQNANHGRYFHVCDTSACGFFLWADSGPPTGSSAANSDFNHQQTLRPINAFQNQSGPAHTVLCNCNQVVQQRTVQKESANKGRKFYSCMQCNFFSWADSTDGSGAASNQRFGRDSNANTRGYSRGAGRKRSLGQQNHEFVSENDNFTSPDNMWPPIATVSRSRSSMGRSGSANVRKCSVCRVPGHTANRCPQNHQ